jgi:hypothetical protein
LECEDHVISREATVEVEDPAVCIESFFDLDQIEMYLLKRV